MITFFYIFIILVFVILSLVVKAYLKLFRARKLCQWLPQAPRLPMLGSVLEFGGHTETLNDFARLTKNSNKTAYYELANRWSIVIRDYDLMEFVLSSSTILQKSVKYDHFFPWLGTGLLTAPGPKWKVRRKVITPAFHFSILEQFVDVFNLNSNKLIKKLESVTTNHDNLDIYNYVTSAVLDTICETAMGVNIDTQNDKNQDYVNAVKDMCRIVMTRTYSPWMGNTFLFSFTEDYKKQQQNLQILHGLTNSVIDTRRRELQSNNVNKPVKEDNYGRKRKMAFLDLLLNSSVDGRPLSQEDIREEVDTFMFEGHDTTSAAIAAALYELADHPEVQEAIREEQMHIYGDDFNRTTTYQDMQDMKYLDLVIKETLRLYPSVPVIARHAMEDIIYKDNVIPKDTTITLYIYGINRDPDYFEAPNEFRPERFLNATGKYPYSYVPFSAGPRNCIGQKFAVLEMKSLISKIVNNYELFPTNPRHKLLLSSEAVLKSRNGVRIKLKKHNWRCN